MQLKGVSQEIQIQLPVITDDKKKVVEDVSKERTHAVDAAIVRTMKSRKRLGLTQVCPFVPSALSTCATDSPQNKIGRAHV